MTQPGDPPASPGSGRSIYERLGLTSTLTTRPRPRLVRAEPVGPRRGTLRLLLGLPILVIVALTLLWTYLPASENRAPSFTAQSNDDDANRIAAQDNRIQQLETRIDVLEIKVRALQEVNGYQPALARRHASRSPEASSPVRTGE